MNQLEKYELVNHCDTWQDLKAAILAFADEDGMILGRTRMFSAESMANFVEPVVKRDFIPNVLTREFGIRQQALYFRYYENI